MSGHLDGPPPGPPDPPYIPGDLGAPSAKEFARRRAEPEPFFTEQQERALDRCEAFDKAHPVDDEPRNPDAIIERLRQLPQYVITIQDREGYTYERGCAGQPMNYTGVLLADVEALIGELKDGAPVTRETTDELKDALREIASFDACGDARSDYRDVIRVKEIAAAALAAADREKPEANA